MELQYWAATDVGRKRSDNEDNFLIDKSLGLFVVADGMGGHASGEIASAIAVRTIREIVASERALFDAPRTGDVTWHLEVCILLEHAVHLACERIFEKARREPEKRGMGTTVVALLTCDDRGYIAYVGDSRLYLVRGEQVYQLTEDHSLMNELLRRGKIREDEIESSPYANFKNAMTRAVGPTETVQVDTLDFDMVPGDGFLLCSDGLYEYLEEEDILKYLGLPEVREVPGQLIDIANRRGGKDNITALVVQVADEEGAHDKAAAAANRVVSSMRSVPLFRELTHPQLVRILNLSRLTPMHVGQVLCREGSAAEGLQVILEGEVSVSFDGTELSVLERGAHFGEMSLIDAVPHSTTVVCRADGRLLFITRHVFDQILKREPYLAVRLLRTFVSELSTRLRETNASLATAHAALVEAGLWTLEDEPVDEGEDALAEPPEQDAPVELEELQSGEFELAEGEDFEDVDAEGVLELDPEVVTDEEAAELPP